MRSVIEQFAEAARMKDSRLAADVFSDDVRLYGVP
jgi:hypothetical protein